MTAICDGCGKVMNEATVSVTKIDPTRWDWERQWKKAGVLIRRMFKAKTKIYCQPCADGRPIKTVEHTSKP